MGLPPEIGDCKMMSPELSNPKAAGEVIVPPRLAGAGSAALTAGTGIHTPAGATQMAALPVLDGFV